MTFTAVVTAIAITIPNIANQMWTVGTAVSLTLPQASGGVGAFTYSLSPTLPAGVSRNVRAVTGNPTTAVVIATYTYTAEDSEGITQTRTFTIVVAAAAVALSFGSETIGDQSWVVGTDVSLALPEATGGNWNDRLFSFAYRARGRNVYGGDTGLRWQSDSDSHVCLNDIYLYRDRR